jgi:hypothetical protein
MALNYLGLAAINFVAALLSIPLIAAGIWLSTQLPCAQILLPWLLLGLGVAVLAVGLAGFVAAFWRLPWLLLAYLVSMLLLIAALACLAAFVFAVTATRGASAHVPPARAFLEYDLDSSSSGWLRARVVEARWDRIKACLAATPTCTDLNRTYATPQEFFADAGLTPLQSGCCKPPTRCGYTFVTPTYWINPIDATANPDCATWSNEQDKFCYSCGSCKAGLLRDLRTGWRRADLIVAVTTVMLLAVYALGCYAFRTAKTDELFSRYRQGYTT